MTLRIFILLIITADFLALILYLFIFPIFLFTTIITASESLAINFLNSLPELKYPKFLQILLSKHSARGNALHALCFLQEFDAFNAVVELLLAVDEILLVVVLVELGETAS